MSSAFGEPPDSGREGVGQRAGAATRRASSAAARAASSRRRRHAGGKARGSYLRPARTLHFVPVAQVGRRLVQFDPSSRTRSRSTSSSLDAQVPDRRPCRSPAGRSRPRRSPPRPTASAPSAFAPIASAPMARAPVRARAAGASCALERRRALLDERERALLEVAACARGRAGARPRGELAVQVGVEHLVERPLRAGVRAASGPPRAARPARPPRRAAGRRGTRS